MVVRSRDNLINENIREVDNITKKLLYFSKVNDEIFLKYYFSMSLELLFSMIDVVKILEREELDEKEIELFQSKIDQLINTIDVVCKGMETEVI